VKLALLLALIMPLPGFVSAWSCDSFDSSAVAAQQHCAHQAGAALQHHNCGVCCSAAAIALLPLPWAAPQPVRAGLLLPLRWPSPSVLLDRLDRPPRRV
jgi:hypothetical protein